MTYSVELSRKAKKDLENLDESIQKNIIKRLDNLKFNLKLGKRLSNILKDFYKLKSGKYRIIYFIDNNKIAVVRIGPRKNIYDSKRNKILKSPKPKLFTEKIIVVNNVDEIIGIKDRYSLDKDDIFRLSALIVKNLNNEILLAKRSETKKNNPGMWGPSVAGTNNKDETYVDNILKEAEEEINLIVADFELKLIEKVFHEGNHKYFSSIFLVTIDEDDIKYLKVDKNEVDSIEWFSKEKLEKELKGNKYKFLDVVETFFKYYDL